MENEITIVDNDGVRLTIEKRLDKILMELDTPEAYSGIKCVYLSMDEAMHLRDMLDQLINE